MKIHQHWDVSSLPPPVNENFEFMVLLAFKNDKIEKPEF